MNSRRRKIYKTRNFENPYFRKKISVNKMTGFNFKNKFLFIIIFIVSLMVYLLFYSSIFRINKIIFSNGTRIGESELNNAAQGYLLEKKWRIFPQNNLILLDKKRLTENLSQKYSFNKIKIDKQLFHTLKIELVEKSYAFIWIEDDKYYYCDNEGFIITEVNPLDINEKKYPIIQNNLPVKIFNNQTSLAPEKISLINELYNKIKDSIKEYPLEKFILDDENSVKAQLVGAPLIIFNFNENLDNQLNKCLVIKNEKLKDDFAKKTYIDLRFGDRVYYR